MPDLRACAVIYCTLAFRVNNKLVIDTKLALWHSTQIALHDDTTSHMGTQHLT